MKPKQTESILASGASHGKAVLAAGRSLALPQTRSLGVEGISATSVSKQGTPGLALNQNLNLTLSR